MTTLVRASGSTLCVEAHGEACLELALMFQEVGHAPAGAVRPDPDGSGEVPLPFPAPDAVGGDPVSLGDLLVREEEVFERDNLVHASVTPDEEREEFAPYEFTYAPGQSPWHGIDENFEEQKHRDGHFVQRLAVVGNYVGLAETHPIRCLKINSLI
ncbi:MAG: hypothetical protein ACLGIE_16580 [Alphaproteobacteria bacterium]